MKYLTTLSFLFASTVLFSACTNQSTPIVNNPDTAAEPSQAVTQQSLKDLLTQNTSQKCTYETSEDGVKTQGEIIIKNNKFKQTTTITDQDGDMVLHAVGDSEVINTWNNKMAGGVKINIKNMASASTESNVDTKVDFDKKIDYRCVPASLSDADFDLPKDIKFTDLTQTMQNLQDNMKNLNPADFDMDQFKDLIPQQ